MGALIDTGRVSFIFAAAAQMRVPRSLCVQSTAHLVVRGMIRASLSYRKDGQAAAKRLNDQLSLTGRPRRMPTIVTMPGT
jgi:hypothetical protein